MVTGSVVRVGDTVRRSTNRWSSAVHELLRHLESVGFDGAPRFLGIDESGREILTWVDGSPSRRPWPEVLLTDDGVRTVARLLRRFHDAVANFEPSDDAVWWTGPEKLRSGEVVLHGDLGPWNMLWRGDELVAFIDWDFAEPGLPLVDVAEAVCFLTPMADDDHALECGFDEVPDRRRRFSAFCDAYGVEYSEVLDAVDDYWTVDIERTSTLGAQGVHPWDTFYRRGLVDESIALLGWFRENRNRFESRQPPHA
jgi:hypothetical protein